MKQGKSFVSVILILSGLVIGAAATFYFTSGQGQKEVVSDAGSETGKSGKKILYWQAPMNPSYISDKPGKSPMGMDLVPVYEGEDGGSEPGTVKVDPVIIQDIGVRTGIVKRMALARDIRAVGRVEYDERLIYKVNTKISGWIEKLNVNFTGRKVDSGEKLLDVYSPELVSTQKEYLLTYRAGEKTGKSSFAQVREGIKSLINASRERLQYWDISDDQIKRLEQTGDIKKLMSIHSPAKGIVIKKHVDVGMFIKPGMNLFTIADISRVWVYADIYEYELPWIRMGQEAQMTLPSRPGEIFTGKVTFIFPYVEKKTRTVKVRIEFDNPGWELKPDMFANVKLKSVARNVVAVPKEALILSGERSVIIIARGGGRFAARDVQIGVEGEDYYEVISGVKVGEKVVTSAQFLIDSESRLKEAISKMLEPGRSKPEEIGKEDVKGNNNDKVIPDGNMGMEGAGMDMKHMQGMEGMNMGGGEMKHGSMRGKKE